MECPFYCEGAFLLVWPWFHQNMCRSQERPLQNSLQNTRGRAAAAVVVVGGGRGGGGERHASE